MSAHGGGMARQLVHTLQFIASHPLNRGRKVHAFSKYLRWQVRSRLSAGPVVYSWVNGAKVLVRRGDTGVTGNIYCGLHEFEDMAYVLHATTSEDLFVDVGANVGTYTILACAVKGAGGVCVEPVPTTYGRLLENLRINNLSGRVEALNLGLADKAGELLFTSGENTMNHVAAAGEPTSETVSVRVSTLDEILKGRRPSVLKIDVEGFETAVLAGGEATLSHPSLHSVIMELNGSGSRYGYDEGGILTTMARFGFMTFHYDPFARSLDSRGGRQSQSGNTLFVREPGLVSDRVRMSPPVAIDGLRL